MLNYTAARILDILGPMSWEGISAIAALTAAIFAALAWRVGRRGVALQEQTSRDERRHMAELVKRWLSDAKYVLQNPPGMGFDQAPAPDFHLLDISNALAQEGLFEGVVREAIEDARKALFDAHRLIEEYHVREVVLSRQFGDIFTPVKNEAISALDKALEYLD